LRHGGCLLLRVKRHQQLHGQHIFGLERLAPRLARGTARLRLAFGLTGFGGWQTGAASLSSQPGKQRVEPSRFRRGFRTSGLIDAADGPHDARRGDLLGREGGGGGHFCSLFSN
jgi:hypothetical protein